MSRGAKFQPKLFMPLWRRRAGSGSRMPYNTIMGELAQRLDDNLWRLVSDVRQ